MSRKAAAWYIKWPGAVYANGPIRFDKPVGIRAVREYAREWNKVDKLPRGFEAWPA